MTDSHAPQNDNTWALRLLSTQKAALELIAKDHAYQDVLDQVCLFVEEMAPGAVCTILLVDTDGKSLRSASGPSADPEYLKLLNGLRIGECAGSCGAAAFLGRPVIVSDTHTDPNWADFESIAKRFSIRSCWSTPFFSQRDRILGTFAINYSEPRAPSALDMQLLEMASYLVGIATERDLLQSHTLHSEKMRALGLLAGGLAHDFNNLLMAVRGNLSMAIEDLAEASEETREALVAAEKAAQLAGEVTQQLLTFARGGAPLKRAQRIEDVIAETAEFVLRGTHVDFEIECEAGLPAADIDRGQISQVIQNVLLNSVQSMPHGGTIRFQLSAVQYLGERALPIENGPYVRVAILDEGTGIPAEHVDNIFDPYFSTKDRGRGLGLATSYSILKQHGGSIEVAATTREGTTMELLVPVALGDASEKATQSSEPAKISARVLVMDDDPSIRDVVSRFLQRTGCDFVVCDDGSDAVYQYVSDKELGRPFDIVLLDLTVPGGMGGQETLVKLRELDVAVCAIAMSGYANSDILANHVEHGFSGALQKPFSMKQLATALAAVSPAAVRTN